jgi:hypothetical protein
MGKVGDNFSEGFRVGLEGHTEEPVEGKEEDRHNKEGDEAEEASPSFCPGSKKVFTHPTVPP